MKGLDNSLSLGPLCKNRHNYSKRDSSLEEIGGTHIHIHTLVRVALKRNNYRTCDRARLVIYSVLTESTPVPISIYTAIAKRPGSRRVNARYMDCFCGGERERVFVSTSVEENCTMREGMAKKRVKNIYSKSIIVLRGEITMVRNVKRRIYYLAIYVPVRATRVSPAVNNVKSLGARERERERDTVVMRNARYCL